MYRAGSIAVDTVGEKCRKVQETEDEHISLK